jgi:hypothetical protein
MGDKLENALAEAIEKANSGIDAATEFVMSELPKVIQQALTWYAVESFIFFCIGLIMLACSYKVVKTQYGVIYKKGEGLTSFAKDNYDMLSMPGFLFIVSSSVLDVLCLIASISWILDFTWLKIWIAPKLWLIEYAAKLAG